MQLWSLNSKEEQAGSRQPVDLSQDVYLKHLAVETKMGKFDTREVRFASHLEPPYTDMDDETYFRKRYRSRSGSDDVDYDCLRICAVVLGILTVVALAIMIAYFALKAESEK